MTDLDEKTQKDKDKLMKEIHEVIKKIDIQEHYRILTKYAHEENGASFSNIEKD